MSDDERPTTDEQPAPPFDRRRELRHTLLHWLGATAACALLWQLRRVVPFVASNLHALIAAVFLYLPTWLVSRRRERFEDYALTHRPLLRGLVTFAVISAIVFPLFAVAMWFYYRIVCGWVSAGVAMPGVYRRMCRRFAGTLSRARLRLPKRFPRLALAQLVVVALPEEYFFRGYVQTRLSRVYPAKRRLFGAPFGWAIIFTSILFAFGHVLVDFNPLRFAVFFPSLAFGWLRASSGSILAGVLFHACCNLVSEVLHAMVFV
ncbi:MAG: CPBP family intramembrane metalloprotease [Myxococcales bacterium]|nr:CPBP family intramembrane metalloprotease [Myxococcales bacterium]